MFDDEKAKGGAPKTKGKPSKESIVLIIFGLGLLLVIGLELLIFGLLFSGFLDNHERFYCGDQRCGTGEDCENCPADCNCNYNERCVNRECGYNPDTHTTPREQYSIALPHFQGMAWNISYTPKSDKIMISSDKCFYLKVYDLTGKEVYAYDSDVKTCRHSSGAVYNATGPNAAAWFNWEGCAGTRYYKFDKGTGLILHVTTDSCRFCVCNYPDFDIYDEIGGQWVKYVNKTAA